MVWREPAYNGRRAGSHAGRKVMSVISQLNIKDAVPIASWAERPRPLKVGVLVDLALTPEAGGHVKCWQRLAEAAAGYPDRAVFEGHFQRSGAAPDRAVSVGTLCVAAAGIQHGAIDPPGPRPHRPGAVASSAGAAA